MRSQSNPLLIIDIYEDVDWRNVDFRPDLPHVVAVGAQFVPDDNREIQLRYSEKLIAGAEFHQIEDRLDDLLARALARLKSFSVQFLKEHGVRGENFAALWPGESQ